MGTSFTELIAEAKAQLVKYVLNYLTIFTHEMSNQKAFVVLL